MATKRSIIVHLERLKMYDKDSKLAFGATLLVTAETAAASDQYFLQPWLWGAVTKFRCVFLDSAGKLIPAATGGRPAVSESSAILAPAKMPDDDSDALRTMLDAEVKLGGGIAQNQGRFSQKLGNANHTYDPKAPQLKPWQAVMGQMAQAPYPVGNWLQLAHQFLVPIPGDVKLADVAQILAAPVLPKGVNFPSADLAPGGAVPPAFNSTLKEWEWSYVKTDDSLESPELKALIRRCHVAPGGGIDANEFVDFNSLWIKAAESYASDWRTTIEPKLGLALDLCQRVIEYIRPFDEKTATRPAVGDLPLLIDLALASLRDQAGLGLRPGPDGERFINKCLRLADPPTTPLTDQEAQDLKAHLPTQFPNVADWKDFLIGLGNKQGDKPAAIPELAQISILTPGSDRTADVGSQLQTLHMLLLGGDGSNLAKLFVAQWKTLAQRPARLTDALLDSIAALPGRVQFRPQLSLELLGAFWSAFVQAASAPDSPNPIEKVPDLVMNYLNRRFQISGSILDLYPLVNLSNDKAKVANFQTYLQTWAGQYVTRIRPSTVKTEADSLAAGTNTADLATTVPHNLSVQVGRLAGMPADRDNREDILGHVRGFVALMRRTNPPSKWRCLNLAQAHVFQPRKVETHPLRGGGPVLVAARLGYVNDLRQMLLTYSNQPLAADSPLTQKTATRAALEGKKEVAALPEPMMHYPFSEAPAALMPGLRFGTSYDFAFFAVSNSGAFPKLQDEQTTLEFPNLSNITPDVPHFTTVAYKRRVRIGQLRVFNAGESRSSATGAKNLALPVIPETVHPRAREIRKDDKEPEKNPDVPLLVLASLNMQKARPELLTSFSFDFRMPATDRETWLRWVFQPSDTPAERSAAADYEGALLKDFYSRADKDPKERDPDISIDDPALLRDYKTGMFLARLEILNATYQWVSSGVGDQWISAEPAAGVFSARGLPAFQREAVRVMCKAGSAASMTKTVDNDPKSTRRNLYTLNVEGKPGEVYRLTIFNCIGEEDFKRFETDKEGKSPIVRDYGTAKINGTGPNVYLVAPFRMMMEVATDILIYEKDGLPDEDRTRWYLYSRIVLADFDKVQTRLQLEVKQASDSDFRHLYRADVMRQVWRWQGRPAAPHPKLEPPGPADPSTVAQWEAVEFGEIRESDHIIYPAAIIGAREKKAFSYTEQLGGPGVQGDRRGLAFRFGIRAYSRYEGWLTPTGASVLAQAPEAAENPGTVWTSMFVAPRPQMPLPAPKVRLIFPLTEGFGESTASSPGMLLVLDEPWYERGGLGEKLVAEVQVSADPRLPPDQNKTFFYETGPDPLFTPLNEGTRSKGLSHQAKEDPAAAKVAIADVIYGASAEFPGTILGPAGHTLEPSNASPLYVASSFILPAPTIRIGADPPRTDLRGYFCKLRLKRTVRVDSDGQTVSSDFTEPYWVQYLPEFSFFDSSAKSVSMLQVRLAASGKEAALVDRQGGVDVLRPFAVGTGTHFLYLVVTRQVFDITGRPDQEVFVGIFRQADTKWIADETILDGVDTKLLGTIRARVVEIQVPSGGSAPAAKALEFWTALFPLEDPAKRVESHARIVRISRPINSSSKMGACQEDEA
jgi:hypothetical protein